MSKILAIVVTYYPDKNLLCQNIDAFVNEVEKVLIWENTPDEKKYNYRFIKHSKVEYCGNGCNSISHALNYGWQYAKKSGYDYLLTMDQDSVWRNFDKFLEAVLLSNDIPSGLWGPAVNERLDKIYVPTPALITSGMLVKIEILDKIGGYDERFVIDGVDMDLCYRAKTYDINSYQINEGMLIQKFGNPKVKKIGFISFSFSNYSPSRRYSTAKSKAMLVKKYKFGFISKLKLVYVELILKILFILIGEDNKTEKIIYSYKGFISGLKNKDLGYINKEIRVI